MSNTITTEQREDSFCDYILDPVNLFMDTLDQVADGAPVIPKEKLDEDEKRFCEAYPDFANSILKYIFKGFVLGLERADIMYGNLLADIEKGSDDTETTTETTK